MKVTTETLERCQVRVTVEVEPKKEQRMLQNAAKRIAREVKIPGFRPGKAPYNVVIRRFGLEAVQQEAFEHSADKMIQDALEEAEVLPYARIQLESIDWDPLTVQIKVPTQPQVELGDYRNIRLEPEPVEVTDKDLEQALSGLQEQTATWIPVDRAAKTGDLISIAVVEKDGDEVLAEHESVEHELSPPDEHEGHNHPDLTTPLLGLSAGDEKSFELSYPDEFSDARYAGKEITFEVEVLAVKEKEVDPLDDEFAKAVSDFDTLAELRTDVRSNLEQQRETQRDTELGNQVLDQIVEEADIVWPEAFEDESVEQEIERQERQMASYGLTKENFLQMQNKTDEEFVTETREQVVSRLKRSLILGKIAELEAVTVTESDILEQAKLIADLSGRGDQLWREILASDVQQNMIANDLLISKVIERLAAIAKGEDPPIGPEDADDTAASDEITGDPTDTAEEQTADEGKTESAAPADAPELPQDESVETAGERASATAEAGPADEPSGLTEDEAAEEPAETKA